MPLAIAPGEGTPDPSLPMTRLRYRETSAGTVLTTPLWSPSMRILIADADRNFLESFQSYMWDCGHDAEFATTGLECSAILYRFIPDVLIIERDLLWGGCDGILAKMRDSADLSRIPVIILASDPQEAAAKLASPNIVARMKKSCQLRDALEQILSAVGPLHPRSDNSSRERLRSLSQ